MQIHKQILLLLTTLLLLLMHTSLPAQVKQKPKKEYLKSRLGPVVKKKDAQFYRLIYYGPDGRSIGKTTVYFRNPADAIAWEGYFGEKPDARHMLDTCKWFNKRCMTRWAVYDSKHKLMDERCFSQWGEPLNYCGGDDIEAVLRFGTLLQSGKLQKIMEWMVKGLTGQKPDMGENVSRILEVTYLVEDLSKKQEGHLNLRQLYTFQSQMLQEIGDFEEAASRYRMARESALYHGDNWGAISALLCEVTPIIQSGNLVEARQKMEIADSILSLEPDSTASFLLGVIQGPLFAETGRPDLAVEVLRKALKASEQVPDLPLELVKGALCLQLAQSYSQLGLYDSAFTYLNIAKAQEAINIASQEGQFLLVEGNIKVRQGYNREGIQELTGARDFFKVRGMWAKKAMTELAIAGAWNELGRSDSGLVWMGFATQSLRHIENSYLKAISENVQGRLWSDLGELDSAFFYFKKNLQYAESTNHKVLIANTQGNLGASFLAMGSLDSAKFYTNQAIQLFESIQGEHPLVSLYNNLGYMYLEEGDWDNAFGCYNQAQVAAGKLGGSSLDVLPQFTLSSLYLQEDNFEVGTAHLRLALETAEQFHLPNFSSKILNSMGVMEVRRDNPATAIPFLKKSLAIQYELERTKDQVEVLNLLAGTFNRMQLPDSAAFYLYTSSQLIDTTAWPAAHIILLQETGNQLAHQKQPQQALGAFNAAKRKAIKSGKLLKVSSINQRIATLHYNQKRFDSAFHYAQYAIQQIEEQINQETGQRTQMILRQEAARAYDIGILSSVALGDYATTFQISESSKARSFSRLLAESTLSSSELPPELQAEIKEFQQKLRSIDLSLNKRLGMGRDARETKIRARNEHLETWSLLRQKVLSNHPDYVALQFPEPVTLPELQVSLQPDEAFISWYIGSSSFVFVVTSEQFEICMLPPKDTWEPLVEAFGNEYLDKTKLWLTQKNFVARKKATEAFPRITADLYETLWKPIVATGLIKDKKLLLSPDGPLLNFPFELLQPDKNPVAWGKFDYLVKNHVISYVPSGTILHQSATRRVNAQPSKEFLGLIGSNFEGNPCASMGRYTLPNFQQSAQLADALPALFPKGKAIVFFDQESSESTLKALDLEDYRYIHFHTHGLINPHYPLSSKIVLVGDTLSEGESGCLELHECFELNLQADLVTLAACNTGHGQLREREGLIGFSRGLMHAGARQVLLSQWAVSEKETNRFFLEFYRRLASKDDRSEAEVLCEVRLQIIEQGGEMGAPYHWAGFVLVGGR